MLCDAAMHKTICSRSPRCSLATRASADTLVDNVNGIQVGCDGQAGPLHRHADRRRRQGRTHAARGEHAPKRATRAFDGRGRTVLPGLIDAHGHVMGLGLRGASARSHWHKLARGSAEAAARLRRRPIRSALDRRPRLEPGTVGRVRFPTAADLDAGVGDQPVALERVDGHAAGRNSAALKAAGITAATKAPAGGKIERDAMATASSMPRWTWSPPRFPPPTPAELDQALAKAQEHTAFRRHHRRRPTWAPAADWAAMQPAPARAGRLNVRIMATPMACKTCAQWCRTVRRRGSTTIGCGWAGSNSTPTARSARAAPG